MKTDCISEYIISFLLREERLLTHALTEKVGYTSDPREMERYKIVIYPSGFFEVGTYGTPEGYPPSTPPLWNGTPLLYGEPRVERLKENGPLIIYADIVASTFFLISRYEEMFYRGKRDRYGRFPGKESYPTLAGFIHRPIIEEYGATLMQLLREEGEEITLPKQGFSQINLTHDIDCPYEYHGFRSFARAWWKEGKPLLHSCRLAFGSVLQDRFWTFPRFLEWNHELARKIPEKCTTILFYKTPGKMREDRPNYRVNRYPVRMIREMARKYDAEEGFHIPLSCSLQPKTILAAHQMLEKDLKKNVTKARFHFLAAREPEDYNYLTEGDIRDDYTMGYADIAGFRLGTCRPVSFIIPNTGQITRLTLHPLTLMDCSLDRPHYMGLGYEDALEYSLGLIEQVAKHHGELTLLFHNDILAKEVHPFHSKLYRELLRSIARLEPQEAEIEEEK